MEAATKGHFRLAGREFPQVTWFTDPALRKTYICLMFVVLTSATNGYDGSMVNGLQSLNIWKECEFSFYQFTVRTFLISSLDFHHPHGSMLGLLNCIMSVGSLVALPVVPYTADILGRRAGILIGCIIM